jgi:hypothetical protein
MDNIAPHSQADLDFVKYLRFFKEQLNGAKRDNQGNNGRVSEDALNTLYNQFYNKIKDRKTLPLMKSATENEELAHLFHEQLVQMCAHSMENYKKGQKQMEPRLLQGLQALLRFNSYNRLLQYEMGLESNFQGICATKTHELCLDFENKVYLGKEGQKLHALSYKILGPCLRYNLETDIDAVMLTSDEAQLAEAQERMYKSESQHLWNHVMEIDKDIRTLVYKTQVGLNDHIKATAVAMTDLQKNVSELRSGQIDNEHALKKCQEAVTSGPQGGSNSGGAGAGAKAGSGDEMNLTLNNFKTEFTDKLANQEKDTTNRMNLLKQQMNDYLNVE